MMHRTNSTSVSFLLIVSSTMSTSNALRRQSYIKSIFFKILNPAFWWRKKRVQSLENIPRDRPFGCRQNHCTHSSILLRHLADWIGQSCRSHVAKYDDLLQNCSIKLLERRGQIKIFFHKFVNQTTKVYYLSYTIQSGFWCCPDAVAIGNTIRQQ